MPSRLFALVTLGILLSISVSGCIPFLHTGSPKRDIDARYAEVFRATVVELRSRGFPVKRVDLDEGRIVTGSRPVNLPGRSERRVVEMVDATVKRKGEKTEVHVHLVFVDQRSGPHRGVPADDDDRTYGIAATIVDRAFETSAVYENYLDAIEARATCRR